MVHDTRKNRYHLQRNKRAHRRLSTKSVWLSGRIQGHLARSARRQDTAEDHRSPPQRVLRARGDPAGGTEWFPTEPFYHRCDVCESSVTGAGAEENDSAVCMLYRPYQSVRLRWFNPPPGSTRPFGRATKYYLGHSSIPRWHASMRAARRRSGWFAVEESLRQGCVLAPLLFNIFFAAVISVASPRFKADKRIMDALVHLRKKRGAGGRGEATAGPGDATLGHALC